MTITLSYSNCQNALIQIQGCAYICNYFWINTFPDEQALAFHCKKLRGKLRGQEAEGSESSARVVALALDSAQCGLGRVPANNAASLQDTVSAFSFEHRRQRIVDRIKLLCSVFAAPVLVYLVRDDLPGFGAMGPVSMQISPINLGGVQFELIRLLRKLIL